MATPVAIGVDVGGTKLLAASVTADGTLVDRLRRTTPARDEGRFLDVLTEVILELGVDAPIGVGVAGMISPGGVIRYGPNIGIRDLPLAELLSQRVGHAVTVTNDASAAVLAEQRVGVARGLDDVAMFTLGTGVGGGLVVNGRLVFGAHGFAGELGHVVVAAGGRRCPCGSRGCVEAYASGTAMAAIARERLGDHGATSTLRGEPELTGRVVTEAAEAGDELAQAVLAEAGSWLGVAAASVVNAFDPQIVVVGGGAAPRAAPWVLPAAMQSMQPHLLGADWRQAPALELASLGDDAGVVGAALLATEGSGTSSVRAAGVRGGEP